MTCPDLDPDVGPDSVVCNLSGSGRRRVMCRVVSDLAICCDWQAEWLFLRFVLFWRMFCFVFVVLVLSTIVSVCLAV